MPRFIYTGTTTEGTTVTETVEAVDKYAVYDIARENHHTVISVTEKKEFSLDTLMKLEGLNRMLGRVKSDELVTFTRNISSMIQAGLPLTRSLSVIERQTRNQYLKTIVVSIRDDINKGKQLNEALEAFPKVFSKLYTSMVRAGEEGGQLADTLQTLSTQMERSSTLKKKVKGAMMYPSIVFSVMIIIGVLMMIFVVPSITATFTSLNVELPMTTQVIIATSDFMSGHPVLVIGGIIGVVVAWIMFVRTRVGTRMWHFVAIRIPVIGIMVREVNAARTARTLASLLKSGVDVINAILITRDVVQNVYYKDILEEAAQRVEKGQPLSEIFIERTKQYPILVGEMIAVGEETGKIAQMLEELAQFYENEVDQKTKDLSTIIEPILMVVIGGGVGFFALAMIAPIYSLSDSIG